MRESRCATDRSDTPVLPTQYPTPSSFRHFSTYLTLPHARPPCHAAGERARTGPTRGRSASIVYHNIYH